MNSAAFKIKRRSFFYALTPAIAFVLAGCATLASSFDPQVAVDEIAHKARFVREDIPTHFFTLAAYSRINDPGKELTVYIEGDGRAWFNKNRLSDDPTPIHPLVLELASLDPSANVVYLARPCQYVRDAHFDPAYWSGKRFSEEVISSMNEALDIFVKKTGAAKIHLIGYSGGGAVAVLLAARRSDIATLRTIAGNLDPEGINQFHGVSPMPGSLNPLDVARKIAHIPQRHFIGTADTTVPGFVSQHFVEAMGGTASCARITRVEDASHYGGWAERWRELLSMPVTCSD